MFKWDKIPKNKNHNGKLKTFLQQDIGIKWINTAKIEKGDDKTIKVSNEKNSLSLKLNDDKTKVYLEIDDVRKDEFIVKNENDTYYSGTIGDNFWIMPEYNKHYFEKWYNKFIQVNDITSLFLVFSFPTLKTNLDEEKWNKCFPFDKSIVQGKT